MFQFVVSSLADLKQAVVNEPFHYSNPLMSTEAPEKIHPQNDNPELVDNKSTSISVKLEQQRPLNDANLPVEALRAENASLKKQLEAIKADLRAKTDEKAAADKNSAAPKSIENAPEVQSATPLRDVVLEPPTQTPIVNLSEAGRWRLEKLLSDIRDVSQFGPEPEDTPAPKAEVEAAKAEADKVPIDKVESETTRRGHKK